MTGWLFVWTAATWRARLRVASAATVLIVFLVFVGHRYSDPNSMTRCADAAQTFENEEKTAFDPKLDQVQQCRAYETLIALSTRLQTELTACLGGGRGDGGRANLAVRTAFYRKMMVARCPR